MRFKEQQGNSKVNLKCTYCTVFIGCVCNYCFILIKAVLINLMLFSGFFHGRWFLFEGTGDRFGLFSYYEGETVMLQHTMHTSSSKCASMFVPRRGIMHRCPDTVSLAIYLL